MDKAVKPVKQLLLLAMLLSGACAADPLPAHRSGFAISAQGQDAGGEFCSRFSLTPAQARWFFKRAKQLEAPQLHNDFDILPCWVQGTFVAKKQIWKWEIRAGGTARLTAPSGEVTLFGCKTCDAVLKD